MKYKLYKNNDNSSNFIKHVLHNRGIDDWMTYLNLTESVVIPYTNLDNIDEAAECFIRHYEAKSPIEVLVDPDVDGYTSAASVINYVKKMNKDYPISYIMHNGKEHGLEKNIILKEDTKLLIIPDAGTNDVEQRKMLIEKGIDIIILDHHESEQKVLDKFGILVNNQTSQNYMNKQLSGVGIVYRFLQYVDSLMWQEYADDFLDLVALGNISDVMDISSFETRYFINKGLSNIQNKCFQALIKAQDYSMNGKVNIHNIQWFITPILNSICRIGTDEEKDILFKAFIEEDEFFEYKKRASKDSPAEIIQESIYDRAARLSKNTKSRQDKLREKAVEAISTIVQSLPSDNKITLVDVTDILDNKGLTGVVAIKIAEMFNKPCILLKKYINNEGKLVYGGSARNIDHSPIESFKDIVNQIGGMTGVGHSQAFGITNFMYTNIDDAILKFNDILKNIEYDSTYYVDYILDANEIDISICNDATSFEDIIGQGIEEPKIAVENLRIRRDAISLYSKNSNTISILMPNGLKYVQFYVKNNNPLLNWLNDTWDDSNEIVIDLVGTPSINEYKGIKTPQIVINDLRVIKIINNEEEETDDDIWD